jgi:DNA adenine methylase
MESETKITPIYKWTGGKRKEIKIFSKYYPDFTTNNNYTYIEPFFGGGAVYWGIEANNYIINDIDNELINFLNVIKSNSDLIIDLCNEYGNKILEITEREKNKTISIADAKKERGLFYYEWRNKDRNGGLKNLSVIERAFRFLLVNQLAFNGMRRFNSKGEFNIPYGNYKLFNHNIKEKHISKLKNTEIFCGDYKELLLNNDNENTFIFIDPPYTREFKEYSHENVFGEKDQIELFDTFLNVKNAKIMIIINKDDFTSNLYKDFIKDEYDLKYSTNIKNRYDNSVKHLIITNY